MTTAPVIAVVGVVVTVLTVLTIGVVEGVDETLVAVVRDTVVDVTGVVVLSETQSYRQYSNSHNSVSYTSIT